MNAPHAKQPTASLEPPIHHPPHFCLRPPPSSQPRASAGFPSSGNSRTHTYPRADTNTETREPERVRDRERAKGRETEFFPAIRLRSKEQGGSKGRRFRKYATHHVQVCPVPLSFPRCIMARVEWRVTDIYGVVHVSVT